MVEHALKLIGFFFINRFMLERVIMVWEEGHWMRKPITMQIFLSIGSLVVGPGHLLQRHVDVLGFNLTLRCSLQQACLYPVTVSWVLR